MLELDYSSIDATPPRAFQLLIAPRAAPKVDHRSIGTTPRGNEYRAAPGSLATVGLVFFDEHFSYIVIGGTDVDLDKTPGALTLAHSSSTPFISRRADSIRSAVAR